MFPLDTLGKVRTIIVHDNCADGLVSAVLLHDALPDAELRFVRYGSEEHRALEPANGLLFCDFSPLVERATDFAEAGTIILDHHRSAKSIVEACGERGIFGDEATEPGVCGAVLALRHVWLPLKGEDHVDGPFTRRFAELAGIRDTWQAGHADWRLACAQAHVLFFMPRTWWLSTSLAEIARSWDSNLRWVGETLVARDEERTRKTIKGSHRFSADDGTRIVAFQGLSATSDAMEMLGDEADLVVGFTFFVDDSVQKMNVSLRSRGTVDCMKLAKEFGGGGHTQAAGFSYRLENSHKQPFRMIEKLLGRRELKATPAENGAAAE